MIVKLATGLDLRLDVLGGNAVRVRLGRESDWGESGLNRYGILNEGRLQDGSKALCRNGEARLSGGYSIKVASNGAIDVKRGRAILLRIHSLGPRPEGGFRIGISLHDSERLYGLGDVNRETLQKRGHREEMVIRNVSSYIPIPYLMSTRGWGILLNTTCYHIVDAGCTQKDELLFECAYGHADFYLFLAGDLASLLELYTRLSGRPALLPRWAYGLTFVSDEREVRARDVLYEAYEYRRHGIPCDGIGLEPGWMEKHYDFSVEKKWSETRFHIPFWLETNGYGTFAGSLHRMGFHLSLWLCCDYDLSEYEERLLQGEKAATPAFEEKGVRSADDLIQDEHLDGVVRIDQITKPGEPWFKHLQKFVDDGADAFKLDGARQVLFHPDRHWFNGMQDYEMHNLYPVIYGKQMANGFAEYTGRRPMIYSPGGYAGIQQYTASWTGDTGGGEKPLCGLLNLAMSGLSNGTCDMELSTQQGIHSGMLMSWSQLLGWHIYSEPWFQGEEIASCFKFYAKLRYRLLPYIYDTAWQAHCTGMPMMRPLPLVFPDDENADNVMNEYMLGEHLLVASFTDRVYLPPGKWYNYWTKKAVKGGTWLQVSHPGEWAEGTSPVGGALFVRAGALIPTAPDMLFSTEKPLDELTWEVYAAPGEYSFTHFDDDGATFAFEQGQYVAMRMVCRYQGKKMDLAVETLHNGVPELVDRRKNLITVFGLPRGVAVKRP